MSIYNIPFTTSLLHTLSVKLLKQYHNNPQDLANCLIFLPNKRLIQSLRDSFLQNANSTALILPKMLSIADLDYIMSSVDIVPILEKKPSFYDIFKSVISSNKRAFILAKIIQKKDPTLNVTQAVYMAKSLGQIIDESYLENVDFSNIENIVADSFAEHWKNILQFLHIVTNFWPQYLKENNMVDRNYHKKLIYQLQQEVWEHSPPSHPVIAINITSNYPTILSLLNTIKNLQNGSLYFYGIDFNETDENYSNLPFTHPQKLTATTLSYLQITRNSIQSLDDASHINDIIHKLFYKKLCKTLPLKQIEIFKKQITIIENKNEEEEARVIALLLRENLEVQGQTAGLISNNKNLIQRVLNELQKWNIISNDYLGTSLHESVHAKFFMQVAKVLQDNFSPSSLLSLLNHPFSTLKNNRSNITRQTTLFNLYIARDLFYTKGLQPYYDAIKVLRTETLKPSLNNLIQNIEQHFQPFFKLKNSSSYKFSFAKLLKVHIEIAENIAKAADSQTSTLWTEQEGKELSLLLSSLLEDVISLPDISFTEYLDILGNLVKDINIHSIYNKHPRIHIYGQMQSSLIHHDLLIISNMNEGSMPTLPPVNPWGNKEIMKKLGFTDKNYLIGIKSNIFCQYLGNKNIVLTRSYKEEGRLTNPSRWLLKIQNMLTFYYPDSNVETKHYIYKLQENLYSPNQFKPLANNIPYYAPPVIALPKKISATNIEKLIKNPYIFFIENILKLKTLTPVGINLEDIDYGNTIHKILEIFFSGINTHKQLSLKQQKEKLITIATKEFSPWQQKSILFNLFKWPLAKRALESLLILQEELIHKLQDSFIEINGEINCNINNNNIILTGRADRIDIDKENNVSIFDYKTSSNTKIEDYQKQLLVLSLILIKQGFKEINPSKLMGIKNNYIFLPKKIGTEIVLKDNGIFNILEYLPLFEQELHTLLNKYYGNKSIGFKFNTDDSDNRISNENKHFMRFNELNITLQHNLDNDPEQFS